MTDSIENVKKTALKSLENMKAKDIVCLDVKPLTSMADFMIVASGTSKRHITAVAENVYIDAKHEGIKASMEGEPGSDWVLVDMFDVIVHIMTPDTRKFYDLEKLWTMSPDNNESND
ncbi:ribosome silencing factor [Gammaproteobacteria bacterium 45_16_T64]|mgnify:CR=1 FL=1|nr:ribosome silencing factor [Gammaproteobacteria bacterium 45_16_T64]